MLKESTGPKIRELFIEELAEVQAGAALTGDPWNTTDACCEEGPFGCCGFNLDDLLRP